MVETVELLPELLLNGHGSCLSEFNFSEVESIKHSHCGLVALVSLEMGQPARLSKDEHTEGRMVGHTDELSESSSVTTRDYTSINSLSESQLKGVLTVVLPHALEVRLFGELNWHLMREDHIFLLDNLWGKFAKSLVLFLESSLALRGAGVHTENDCLVLVGVGE